MRSETPIENHGNLREVQLTPKADEISKIEQNYKIIEKDGKITYEEPPHVKEKKKLQTKEEIRQQFAGLKIKKQNGILKADDLYPLIEKLLQ